MEKTKEYTDFFNLTYLIKTEVIREFVVEFIKTKVPSYFYTIAASSTGKYHPEYALGEGGCARHVIAATLILRDLLALDCWKGQFTQIQTDQMFAAVILHDCFKRGLQEEEHTTSDHEIIARDEINKFLQKEETVIGKLVSTHMGQWGKVKPTTTQEMLVHTADYLASRKHIEIKFDK